MREGIYSSLTFQAPQKLMNTATAPQALSKDNYAQAIVNMVPTKGGTLAIRNGTVAIGAATANGNIIEIMPFVKVDGTSQTLVYTDTGKICLWDEALNTYSVVKSGLNTSGTPFYDNFNEGGTPYLIIVNGYDTPMKWDGSAISVISEYVTELGTPLTWIGANSVSVGTGASVGATNYPNGRSARVVFTGTGFSITGITRVSGTATATTAVNHNFAGTTIVTIAGAVQTEYNGTFVVTPTGANTFTYSVVGAPATPATGVVTYGFSSVAATGLVSSTTVSGAITTIVFTTSILPAASVTITSISYEVSPPAFSFIYSGQDRLWALGPGEIHPTVYRSNAQRAFVYYTVSRNVIGSWYSPTTQALAFFDPSNKMPDGDELNGISEIDGAMVFFGRKCAVLFAGTDPSNANTWAWAKTIPVGLVMGKLIQKLPNDVAFVNDYGIVTLRTTFTSGQVQSQNDIGSPVDVTVLKEVEALRQSATAYKAARSFFYEKQGLYGFKLSDKTLVLKINENSRGWVEFVGDFANVTAFGATPDKRLLLSNADTILRYADGSNSSTLTYSDQGTPISWAWWTPWVGGAGRWANHAYEVIHNDADQITFEIVKLKDNSLGFQSGVSITTSLPIAFWDESFWDASYWDGGTTIPKARDKWVALTFSFVIRGQTTTGPFEIVAFKAYGQWER